MAELTNKLEGCAMEEYKFDADAALNPQFEHIEQRARQSIEELRGLLAALCSGSRHRRAAPASTKDRGNP